MSLTAHDLASNMEGFSVPASIVTRADAARLWRELEKVENDLQAQAIRQQPMDLSIVGVRLADLAEANGVDLAKAEGRTGLSAKLKQLKDGSPVVHIAFAEEPRPEVMQQFTTWIRQNLHPAALMQVGLQPSLVAGCVVRTPSHVYDFSIRAILDREKPKLVHQLLDSVGQQAPAVIPAHDVIPAQAGIQIPDQAGNDAVAQNDTPQEAKQ